VFTGTCQIVRYTKQALAISNNTDFKIIAIEDRK